MKGGINGSKTGEYGDKLLFAIALAVLAAGIFYSGLRTINIKTAKATRENYTARESATQNSLQVRGCECETWVSDFKNGFKTEVKFVPKHDKKTKLFCVQNYSRPISKHSVQGESTSSSSLLLF